VPILSRRIPLWLALAAIAAAAVVVVVALSFVLRDGEEPSPVDGIGDIPTAHLVPEDAALYVALRTDLDGPAWQEAFALLERLGIEDIPGELRAGLAEESEDGEPGLDWESVVEPFLGGVAVLFLSGSDEGEDGDRSGAVIFRANDAGAAEAVILDRREDAFEERTYRDVAYRVMENGGVLAVVGDHLVYASDETAMHAVLDARVGEVRPLADSTDFRRLRNTLEGDALAFVYLAPGRLMTAAFEGESRDEDASGEEAPDLLALAGLDELFAEPIGVVIQPGEDAIAVRAALLGDPGPIVTILRPRESRFAQLVPAETAIFVSTYDIAGVVDEVFDSSGFGDLIRDALADAGEEGDDRDDGGLGEIEDVLALFTGEFAFALWQSDDGETAETVLLAEVESENRARELLTEFLGDALENGDAILSIDDGFAVLASSQAALDAVRDSDAPGLAASARYYAAVAALDSELATFVYVDIWGLLGSPAEEVDLDLGGLGLIVNLVFEDDRVQAEGALGIAPAD